MKLAIEEGKLFLTLLQEMTIFKLQTDLTLIRLLLKE